MNLNARPVLLAMICDYLYRLRLIIRGLVKCSSDLFDPVRDYKFKPRKLLAAEHVGMRDHVTSPFGIAQAAHRPCLCREQITELGPMSLD